MKMQDIRKIAKSLGVDARAVRSKQEIIKDIQLREGNAPCFRTKDECENECLWKADCL